MKYRRVVASSIALALTAGIVLPALLVVLVDPFRIYHDTWFPEQGFSRIQQFQAAGLINTFLNPAKGYDTIVVGASTADNFYPEDVTAALGSGKTLNLAINGTMPVQQTPVIRHALATGHVRYVLWDMHTPFFGEAADTLPTSARNMPYYLYNDTWLDDYRYWLNGDNLRAAWNFLRGNFYDFRFGINRASAFYEDALADGEFDRFINGTEASKSPLDVLRDAESNWLATPPYQPSDFSYPSIDRNMLDIVLPLCNTPIEFRLLFSPHYRMLYSRQGNIPYIYKYVYMRRYLLEKTQQCHNVRIYAFDNDDSIANETSNYMDDYHFRLGINRRILAAIATDQYRLTPENLAEYETTFLEKIHQTRIARILALGGTLPEPPAVQQPHKPLKLHKRERQSRAAGH